MLADATTLSAEAAQIARKLQLLEARKGQLEEMITSLGGKLVVRGPLGLFSASDARQALLGAGSCQPCAAQRGFSVRCSAGLQCWVCVGKRHEIGAAVRRRRLALRLRRLPKWSCGAGKRSLHATLTGRHFGAYPPLQEEKPAPKKRGGAGAGKKAGSGRGKRAKADEDEDWKP